MSDIRPNRAKQKLADGGRVHAVQGLITADLIDQVGPSEVDAIWIEAEHGGTDFQEMADHTRACDLWGKTSLVRVHSHEYGLIYRTLDRGAQGIVVPHVNTREQADSVVRSAKFAPIGNRGMFVSRQGYGVGDYARVANDHTMVIVLIEDIEAARNLDEILEVEHIDCFFVAPNDLAQSMGHVGDVGHAEVQTMIGDIVRRIAERGRVAGVPGQDSTVDRYKELGARFFLSKAEEWILSGISSFATKLEG